jgi:hypothetical protein
VGHPHVIWNDLRQSYVASIGQRSARKLSSGRGTRTKQVSMRRSDIRPRTASVRLSLDQNTETPRWCGFWSGLSLIWSRLESQPAFVFLLFSFVFGSAISGVVPPLRGPDEIAHFLRIYSYTRGGFYQPRKSMVARESSSSASCTPSSRSSRTQENASSETENRACDTAR